MLRLILRRRCLGRDIRVELLLCNCLLDLCDRRSQSCDLIVSVWYRAHVRVRFRGAGLAQFILHREIESIINRSDSHNATLNHRRILQVGA